MSEIHDNDLILFHYRDGLPPERLREIELALAASPTLEVRYQALRRVLGEADRDVPPLPDAQFENRLWQRLQPRLDREDGNAFAGPPQPRPTSLHRARPRHRWQQWGAGLAAAAVLVMALYFPLSNDSAPQPPSPVAQISVAPAPAQVPAAPVAADRALTAYVATHLRSTEGVLLSVINNDGTTLAPAGDAFARSLVSDNRLYAAAAAQNGDRALAGFLESLEPMLIELANQPRDGDVEQARALREHVRGSDLLFQVRAVEARLQSRGDHRAQT